MFEETMNCGKKVSFVDLRITASYCIMSSNFRRKKEKGPHVKKKR